MSYHDHGFIREVLDVFALDRTDDLFWRTDGEHAPITFFAICNDVFAWGTADLERIQDEDLAALRQAISDAVAADPREGRTWGVELWIARKRRWRPQAAIMRVVGDALRPLFEACGPARDEALRCHPHERLTPDLQRRVDMLANPDRVRAGDAP